MLIDLPKTEKGGRGWEEARKNSKVTHVKDGHKQNPGRDIRPPGHMQLKSQEKSLAFFFFL